MEKGIKVELLFHADNPEKSVATAARLCYSAVGASELLENMSEEQSKRVLSIILESGHTSTLEHATYTFAVEGISRACSHQFVRHRLASFNQQSQRYVKIKGGLEHIKPDSVKDNPAANEAFDEVLSAAEEAYHKMIEAGIPAEDARYVLPNAAETKLVVTMNIRELLHFFSLRCCNRAQWEIREVAWQMLELARPTAPFIFADAGPDCVRGKCGEGKMCCGNPFPSIDRKAL